jgi:hypothetical protein
VDLVAVEEQRLVFQVGRLAGIDVTLACVCLEAARAFVLVSGLDPYRASPPVAERSAREDVLAGVAAVYFGFGAVLVHAARRLRRVAELRGEVPITRTQQFVVGALSTSEVAFLLAATLVVRLAPEGEVSPLDEALQRELEAAELANAQPMSATLVRRYYERRTGAYTLVGLLVALTPAMVLLLNHLLQPAAQGAQRWRGRSGAHGGGASGARQRRPGTAVTRPA